MRLSNEPEIGEGRGSLKAFLCRRIEIIPTSVGSWVLPARAGLGRINSGYTSARLTARAAGADNRGDIGDPSAKALVTRARSGDPTPWLRLNDLIGLRAVKAVHVERPL